MDRKIDESYISYVDRASQSLADGLIGYQEWAEAVLGEALYSEENLRRCFVFFNKFLDKLDKEEVKSLNDENRVNEIKKAQEDLIKERKKLQQQNTELQATYRYLARNELSNERILEAIQNLEPIQVKTINVTPYSDVTGLLCLSDFHAGSTYEVNGLYGEIVNQYNYDIMCNRLWKVIGQIEADDLVMDELVVGMCGDFYENLLRISSLTKLREPVIDTVIKFSNFLCDWVIELHNRLELPITVVTVGGNHDTCSFLGSSPRLENENLTKITTAFMEIRLKGIDGINIDPYTDASVKNIRGTNILFEHGEDKDLKTTIDYFSNLYNIDIDEIIAGHLHSPEMKTIGITDIGNRTIRRVGSICGIDPFSKKIRKSARPSAYMAMYTNEGLTWNREYYL